MNPVNPKPLLSSAKWIGLGLTVLGLGLLIYGVVAVANSGCNSYVGDVSQPACQWATPPGIFAILGGIVLILGIIAIVVGIRAKAVRAAPQPP